MQGKPSDPIEVLKKVIEEKISQLAEKNRHLKRKIFDFHTIFDISRQLNSMLEPEALLDNILLTCIGQLGAGGAAIAVQKNPDEKKLSLSKIKGITSPLTGKAGNIKLEFDAQGSLSGFLSSKNTPFLLQDIENELGSKDRDVDKLKALECEVCVPLLTKNHLRGILILTPKVSGKRFDQSDFEFLTILVNQLSVAVENALLYESEKQTNLLLRETQEQLFRTEKLAALGALSAKVAHEVNNPLGIIKNYLTIISGSLKVKDPNSKHIKMIKQEVDRIARIVRQLLNFHRPERKEMTEVDLAKVLEETITLVDSQFFQENIEIEKDFSPNLPPVCASKEELKQVFLNLLLNSKDFMPQGGKILIQMALNRKNLEIRFSDTGYGIPEKNLPLIFEPYFTTKDNHKGTGLGLWICQHIIERHQGAIRAENRKEKKGATFVITLPKAKKVGR